MKMERALTKAARDKLENRFDIEREADRKRITIIKDDLERLKTGTQEGSVTNKDLVNRFHQAVAESKLFKGDHDINRFHGLETPIDFILHKANVGMFDKHDQDFKRRVEANKPKFDIISETKRYNLLQEKRDILRQVVQVQQREINEMERKERAAVHSVSTGRAIVENVKQRTRVFYQECDEKSRKMAEWQAKKAGGGARRGSSASSVCSSRASTASMATFASASASRQGPTNRTQSSRVPRLPI